MPQCIFNGTKPISISYRNVTLKDSYAFIPMALSNFSKTFNLTELKKGFFLTYLTGLRITLIVEHILIRNFTRANILHTKKRRI